VTLRARLALAVAVVVVVLILSGLALTALLRSSDTTEIDHQLVAVSLAVSATAKQLETFKVPLPATAPEIPYTELYIGGIAPDSDHVVTYIRPALNPDGVPVVRPDEAAAHVAPKGGTPQPFDAVSTVPGGGFRVASVSRPTGGYILVALPTDRMNATFRRIVAGIVLAGSVLLATLVVMAWWVSRLGLRPIANITAAAEAIAAGDLDRRVDAPKGRTEASQLARAFNVMVDERQAWEDQLRRFVADASHELRTPLTTIVGVMELHRAGALPAGPRLDDALRRADREAQRMSGLLEDLLLLARLDQGRPLAIEPVDLGQLTADVVYDARLSHPDRPIQVDVRPIPLVPGDETRLRQVVTNLVANAVTHTGPGTEVRVQVHLDRAASGTVGPACLLEVSDDGPGMTANEARHVFDRFYRVDAGRGRAGPAWPERRPRGGAGLGLSIVSSIVAAHGGQVSVRTAPGQGATFRVALPLAHSHLQETSRPSRPSVEPGEAVSRHDAAAADDRRSTPPVPDRISS
jgi:two-component system OmpR family sensor kinase